MTHLIHENLFAVLKTGMNIWLYVSALEDIVSSVLVFFFSLISVLPYESWRGISNENDNFCTFSPQYLSNNQTNKIHKFLGHKYVHYPTCYMFGLPCHVQWYHCFLRNGPPHYFVIFCSNSLQIRWPRMPKRVYQVERNVWI